MTVLCFLALNTLEVIGTQGRSLKAWTKDQCTQLSTEVIYFPEGNNMYKTLKNYIDVQHNNLIRGRGGFT
jgi:hypothetical protein